MFAYLHKYVKIPKCGLKYALIHQCGINVRIISTTAPNSPIFIGSE